MTERPEFDEFAAELQRALKETYRKVTKPKNRLIVFLATGYVCMTIVSILQAVYIWSMP